MDEIEQQESWALTALIHGDLEGYVGYINKRNELRERHPFQCIECGEHLHCLPGESGEDAFARHACNNQPEGEA